MQQCSQRLQTLQLQSVIAISALSLLGGVLAVGVLLIHIRINTTASAPTGVYWYSALLPGSVLQRGDLVVMELPVEIAVQVQPLLFPDGHAMPLLKEIAAVPGDTVCIEEWRVLLNGAQVATRVSLLTQYGIVLQPVEGCWMLGSEEYFLLNRPEKSFDGRYVGATDREHILGRVVPVWTWGEEK